MMQLRHIEYFLATVDAGSISEAARRLHVTQPTLSRQLQQLEKDLSVTLFERTAGRAELGRSGRALIPHARALISAAQQLDEAAALLAHGGVTQLTIGAPGVTLTEVVSPFVATMTPLDPVIQVQQGDSAALMDLLNLGADLAIGVLRPPAPFVSLPLAELNVWAYVPRTHRWVAKESRTSVSVDELIEEPLIVLPRYSSSRQALESAVTARGQDLVGVVETSNGTIAQALAASGRGAAVVTDDPRFNLIPLAITAVSGEKKPLRITMLAAWDERSAAAPAIKSIAERLGEWVRAQYPESDAKR